MDIALQYKVSKMVGHIFGKKWWRSDEIHWTKNDLSFWYKSIHLPQGTLIQLDFEYIFLCVCAGAISSIRMCVNVLHCGFKMAFCSIFIIVRITYSLCAHYSKPAAA